MRRRLLLLWFINVLIILCVGCGSKKNVKKSNKVDKSVSSNKVEEEKVDYKEVSSYATANYFNEKTAKVTSINYYSNGNVFEFKADSKEGKKFLDLIKKRFIYFGEPVSKRFILKDKIEDIKTNGKAIEVVFDKGYIMGIEAQKNTDYRSLPIEVDSWFFPLDCAEEVFFTYLPQSDYTFGKLGNSSELRKYIKSLKLK